jgi:hypothetical protein
MISMLINLRKLPKYSIIGFLIFVVGILVIWLVFIRSNTLVKISSTFPTPHKITNPTLLKCQEVIWGHVHTRNDALDVGTQGWSQVNRGSKQNSVSINVTSTEVIISNSAHSGIDGIFVINPKLQNTEVTATTSSKTFALNLTTGQVIVNSTIYFAGGYSSDSIIYNCIEDVSRFDVTDILNKIPEVILINQKIKATGRSTSFVVDEIKGGTVTIALEENTEDHLSRIATFIVDTKTSLVLVYDVASNTNIPLETWQHQVRDSWK